MCCVEETIDAIEKLKLNEISVMEICLKAVEEEILLEYTFWPQSLQNYLSWIIIIYIIENFEKHYQKVQILRKWNECIISRRRRLNFLN